MTKYIIPFTGKRLTLVFFLISIVSLHGLDSIFSAEVNRNLALWSTTSKGVFSEYQKKLAVFRSGMLKEFKLCCMYDATAVHPNENCAF